jgi:hypothetical protein
MRLGDYFKQRRKAAGSKAGGSKASASEAGASRAALGKVVVIDDSPEKSNWITNKSGAPVSIATKELFGSSHFDLSPGQTIRVSFNFEANAYPLGQYSFDDLKYNLGEREKWEVVRDEQGELAMNRVG